MISNFKFHFFKICIKFSECPYVHLLYRSSRPEVLLRKGFWKYAANLEKNTHADVWSQKSCKAICVKCFEPGFSASKNLFKLFKATASVNSNAPAKSTTFEQMFVRWDEIYLQNEKFKKSLCNRLMKNKTK